MANSVFNTIKAIAKRLTVLMMAAVLFLGFSQTAAQAATFRPMTESLTLIEIPEVIPDQELGEKQEQRREWQSKASASQAVKEDDSESLGETLNEKLNLGEITETMKDNLNLDNEDDNAAQRAYETRKRVAPDARK